MHDIESAARIAQIHEQLLSHAVVPEHREILCAEQSNLWEAEHPGRPLEDILHDVWRFRRWS